VKRHPVAIMREKVDEANWCSLPGEMCRRVMMEVPS
jgi:hypothetical protein